MLTPDGGEPFTELSATGTLPDSVDYRARAQATAIKALGAGSFAFELYVGPQEWRRLTAMGRDLENVNPYGGFMQGIVQPFATAVMQLLLWIKERTQLNYGWVLIIFGVAIRILLWPLNQRAMRSTMKMSAIQPEMAAIPKRYKEDPAKLQSEMIKLYKEHGVSPLSMFSGCLPMLLPMPFLIALFFVFQNTIEFRGVSFLWLPDISVKDPFYILPILYVAVMIATSYFSARGNPQMLRQSMIINVVFVFVIVNFLGVRALAHTNSAATWRKIAVPLAAMLVSDLALGLVHGTLYAGWIGSTGFWLVYLCIAASVALGFGLRGRAGAGRVLGYGLAGSVWTADVAHGLEIAARPTIGSSPTRNSTSAPISVAMLRGSRWTDSGSTNPSRTRTDSTPICSANSGSNCSSSTSPSSCAQIMTFRT